MTTHRLTRILAAAAAIAAVAGVSSAAAATSTNDPLPAEPHKAVTKPLFHKGAKVGTVAATTTVGFSGVATGNVVTRFSAPRAGLVWKARVIASFTCTTDIVLPGAAGPEQERVSITTPWNSVKAATTKVTLRARGFSHRCPSGLSVLGPVKVRAQVSQASGASYAFATLVDTAFTQNGEVETPVAAGGA